MSNYYNEDYSKYTYLHRKALQYYIVSNQYLSSENREEMLKRAEVHDMDKLVLYQFWEKEKASKYHRQHNLHHIAESIFLGNKPTYYDYMEAIFDFECAAITKPDKPLNAYDTLNKFYPELKDKMLPVLKKLHMDSSYNAITEEAKNYILNFCNTDKYNENDIVSIIQSVDFEKIKKEIGIYLSTVQQNICVIEKICTDEQFLEMLKWRNIQ